MTPKNMHRTRMIISVALIALIITNLVLYAMGRLSHLIFYVIAAVIAFAAFRILPKMRSSEGP